MRRRLFLSLAGDVSPASKRVWLGGFNLLPYRQRNVRLARRRCLLEWCVAALAGCVAVLAVVGWQAFERVRLDERRAKVERSLAQLAAPLAEQTKLLGERDAQRKRVARAAQARCACSESVRTARAYARSA